MNLLKKYDVAGPRYTSYPTVPYWEGVPTEAEWIESVKLALESEEGKAGAALYVHIPFCQSLCSFCGCNTRITRNHAVAQPYIDGLLKEWGLLRERLGRKKILLTELHLGGGTPTFLTPDELDRLLTGLEEGFTLTGDPELSLEVDPRVTNEEHLKVLRKHAFTRLSMGVQDFEKKVQEAVHRIQSVEQVRALTEYARAIGFTSVNYDLIYGLPFQTPESLKKTMEIVAELKPDRIAFYGYAHVPWIKPAHRRFTESDLPAGDGKRALYETGREVLRSAGYHELGMDHFALETDPLWIATTQGTLHRNFMGYASKPVFPLLAIGVSSIGDSGGAFVQNEKLLETWKDRVEKGELPIARGHLLSLEDSAIRKLILSLMTRFEANWTGEEEKLVPFLSEAASRLEEAVRDGLIEITHGKNSTHLRITTAGKPFIRNLCMALDARLARKAPETRIFSQTI